MPRPRSGSKTLTVKFLETMTSEEFESMTPEKRASVVQRLGEEKIRVKRDVHFALLYEEDRLRDESRRLRDARLKDASTSYVSTQGLGEEDPCIPSCGPYE